MSENHQFAAAGSLFGPPAPDDANSDDNFQIDIGAAGLFGSVDMDQEQQEQGGAELETCSALVAMGLPADLAGRAASGYPSDPSDPLGTSTTGAATATAAAGIEAEAGVKGGGSDDESQEFVL